MIDKAVDIQIPDIEKDLAQELDLPPGSKQQKACLFTLIIYAKEPRNANYLKELVDTILDKFPCRIIYIHLDNNAETSYLHTTASTVKSKSGSSVVCDQINIDVSKDQLYRVPFLVIPHLVPDLPVYLLWGQDPFAEKEVFPHLHAYAERVIFDSECSESLRLFCTEMQKNLTKLSMEVMDINWALVSNWRDMLALLFDTPEKILQLDDCKSIVINYNGMTTKIFQHPEIRAIYLQGWIAARLNWTYHQTERIHGNNFVVYRGPKNPVVIALTPQMEKDLPPGAIISIQVTLTSGETLSIERKTDLNQVIVHTSSDKHCDVPFTLPLPNIHRGFTFMREIFYGKLGDHYLEMLQMISQIDYRLLKGGTPQ